MQLKKDPNEVGETLDGVQQGTQQNVQETLQSAVPSNNDYFNPEQEFDFQGDGIFGNQSTNSFDMSDPNNQGMNNTGSYGAGMGGAGSYYNAGGNTTPNDGYNPDSHPRKMSKQEFYESPRNRKNRDRIVISSIVIIVCAIADWIKTSFMVQLLRPQIEKLNELSETLGVGEQYIIDVDAIMRTQIIISLFFIALGVGIFILKSRACALTGLIISIIFMLYNIISAHKFNGYFSLIAFGFATAATFAAYSAWREYEENGDWKREW